MSLGKPWTLTTSEASPQAPRPPPPLHSSLKLINHLKFPNTLFQITKAEHKPDKNFGCRQKEALAALTTLAVQAVLAAIAAPLGSCNCSGWSDISGSRDSFSTSSNRQPRQL
jgi:hypothetical protein